MDQQPAPPAHSGGWPAIDQAQFAEALRVLGEIRDGLAERPAVTPQMFDPDGAALYCGLSRSAMYRLISAEEFPAAVRVEGSGPRWRRQDLDRWIEKLKPARRKPKMLNHSTKAPADRSRM